MPQSNLGKNFCWLVFAGLLAVLAGCTPGQYATQDRAYTPPSTYTPGSSYPAHRVTA